MKWGVGTEMNFEGGAGMLVDSPWLSPASPNVGRGVPSSP